MAIAPRGLESIAADKIPAAKLKTLVAVTNSRSDDFTHHVRLAPARRARAGTAQEAERQKGLAPVIPLNGEFTADLLDICRLEAHDRSLTAIRSAGQYFARKRAYAVVASGRHDRGHRSRLPFVFQSGRENNFGFFPAFLCS